MSHRSPDDEEALMALIEAVPPAELSAGQRASMRARVMARIADVAPAGTETVRGNDLEWREAWPKVWVKVMRVDVAADMQVTLMRFEPGGRIPGHAHRAEEECYVIQGEVFVGAHLVRAGDFHVAHAGGTHPDLFSSGGALVMLRSELHRAQPPR